MVSNRMIDLITVVFEEELNTLKLQAKSIDLYFDPAQLAQVYVIVNDADHVMNKIDPAWWGKFKDQVVILPRRTFSCVFSQNGWHSQQVLKLLTATLSYNEWSMVLDAKTLFVRDVIKSELFDRYGRPCVGSLEIYPVFEPSQRIVEELFDNMTMDSQLGPGGVPFMLNNHIVRNMIVDIERRTQQSFANWFATQGMLTEFLLYSGYVIHKHGSFDMLYNQVDCNIQPCNLCHSEVASFDRKFRDMTKPSTLTVSIHRAAWPQLSPDQQDQFKNFLESRGLTCEL